MTTRLAVAGIFTMFGGLLGCAHAVSAATVEVVASVPVETTLAVPGVRDTQTVWLQLAGSATESIDLEEFYINEVTGQSLTPVIQAIEAAAARGVHVRFLLDHGMYASTYSTVPNQLNQIPNIEVRTIDFSSRGGIMHAKTIVVDGQRAYVGSANFDWLALTHIHEVGLHVTDAPTSTLLESVFNKDWASGVAVSSTGTIPNPEGPVPATPPGPFGTPVANLQVLASPPDLDPPGVGDTLDKLTAIIGAAKHTVHVQVYEYNTVADKGSGSSSSPWTELDGALRAAAARGVRVELMTDAVALKQGKADLEAIAKVPNVQVKIVTIPQWSGGPIPYARLIHSKYLVADGAVSWVGSENWNENYFTNTRNVGLTLADPTISTALEAVFNQVWTSAYTSAP